jgi:hypothetical protein
MLKSIAMLAAVSLFWLSVNNATGQEKKYDIKSGIVTFDNISAMGKMKITNKEVVYFDDFGMKECKETFEDGKLKESFFSDGKTLYKLIHGKQEAYKMGDASRGTELRCDWNEVSEKDKKEGKAKQLPEITIAGKKCQAFQVTSSSGTTKFAGWNHICMLTDLTSKGMSSVTKAVSIQENAKVSPDKFNVPAGYKIKQF